jgi:hypothetical protein
MDASIRLICLSSSIAQRCLRGGVVSGSWEQSPRQNGGVICEASVAAYQSDSDILAVGLREGRCKLQSCASDPHQRSTWCLCLLQWPPVRRPRSASIAAHRPLVWFATSLCLLSFCPQLHLTPTKHHHHPPTTLNATTVVSLFPCCLTIDLF